MALEKHNLVNDFPEHHHTIRHLKMHDKHFLKMYDDYHQIDGEIPEIKQNNSPVADDYLESCKVQRVQLKDPLLKTVIDTKNAL